MQQREEEVDLNYPDNENFEDLERKINTLLPTIEGKLLINAIDNISDMSKVIKLIEQGTIKVDKSKLANVQNHIKTYYDGRTNQNLQDMIHEGQNYGQIREVLREQLEEKVSQFLKQCGVNQTTAREAAQSIADKKPVCDVFLDYDLQDTLKTALTPRVVTIIRNFDSYNNLREFNVDDINVLRKKFSIEFLETFESTPSKVLREVLNEILKDPNYYFTNRSDLNDNQKKTLIEGLWLKENSLWLKLVQAHRYKGTIAYIKQSDIQNIIFYLIYTCKYGYTLNEIGILRSYLENFELVGFFSANDQIANSITNIYNFINTNCTSYMRACQQKECIVELKTKKQMLLKQQLFDRVQHFSYSHWAKLEERIMEGDLNVIERYIYDQEQAYQLRIWIKDNLGDYLKLAMTQQTVRDRVKAELTLFLINQKIRNLTFEGITIICNQLLDNPYFEVIEASPKLTTQDQRNIKKKFSDLPEFNEYKKFRKIDLKPFEREARMRVEYEINKMNYEKKYQISKIAKEKLIAAFLLKPKNSSVFESEDVGDKYKLQFISTVSSIPEVKTYIQKYDFMCTIKKEESYLKKLQEVKFPASEVETLKQYICVHGEISINNEDKCTVSKDYSSVTLILNPEKCRKLKEAQSTPEFRAFKEDLPLISKLFKQESVDKLIQAFVKYVSAEMLDEEKEEQLTSHFKAILEDKGVINIFKNEKFQGTECVPIVTSTRQNVRYIVLETLENNLANNKRIFAELNLKKKVRDLYNHPSFMKISPEEKTKIIEKVESTLEFSEILTYPRITDEQKKSLTDFIKDSEEYKACPQLKGLTAPIPEKKITPVVESSPLTPIKKSDSIRTAPNTAQSKSEASIEVPKFNPEVIKPQEKKEVVRPSTEVSSNQEEQRFVEEESSRWTGQKPQSSSSGSKAEILTKWDNRLLQFKDRSQFRNARGGEFKDKENGLIQQIMNCYPWGEKSFDFWKAGSPFQRKNFANEMNAFLSANPDILGDIELLKNAAL